MSDRIQFRRGTEARWLSVNPVLMEGEIGYVTDKPNLHKMGDGVNKWTDLPYRGFDGTLVHEHGDGENVVMTQKAVTDYVDALGVFEVGNDEFIRAITDEEGTLLFGIRYDGSIYQSDIDDKTKSKIAEVISQLTSEIAIAKEDSDRLNDAKVDKVDGKGLIETAKAETIDFVENEEYVHAIVDAVGKTLFGIKTDGSYDMPDKDVYHIIQNEEYFYAILDAADRVVFGITREGLLNNPTITDFYKSLAVLVDTQVSKEDVIELIEEKTGCSFIDSEEYLKALVDSEGKVVFAINLDGSFYLPNNHLNDIIDDIEGRTELVLDAEGKVVAYRDAKGVKHENSFTVENDFSVKDTEAIKIFNQATSDSATRLAFGEQLKADGFSVDNVLDLSSRDFIEIPKPRLGMLNIISSSLPTAKSGMGTTGVTCDIPCELEFWDGVGNYFKKNSLISAQGDSSMIHPKKNFSVDIFNGEIDDDDSASIKIGNWVSQDSFHFKAYYSDFFRGIGAVAYKIYDDMSDLRGLYKNRVWKRAFIKEGANYDYYSGADNNLLMQHDSEARCYPDGFPMIIYHNGEFYGIYSFQLKKHRDNMMQSKSSSKHIHLDGTIGGSSLFGGVIDWTQFEVRNPKDLRYHADGTKYNGDYPKEIMGYDSEYYVEKYKHTAEVKEYIINLSKYAAELNAMISSGESKDSIRERLSEMFDIESMVDYICFNLLFRNNDAFNKNWQWTTYDGVKWYVNPYDMDGVLGAWSLGSCINKPDAETYNRATASNLPSKFVLSYFEDEIKEAWSKFRDAGVFDVDFIIGKVKQWTDAIGTDNFSREFAKWSESPCNRDRHQNTSVWKYIQGYFNTYWSASITYNIGSRVYSLEKCYYSLTNNNIGNPPSKSPEHWRNDSYDENKEYNIGDECYHGKSILYKFSALVATKGQPPITNFYSQVPYELGHRDSIFRLYDYVKSMIDIYDIKFNYIKK